MFPLLSYPRTGLDNHPQSADDLVLLRLASIRLGLSSLLFDSQTSHRSPILSILNQPTNGITTRDRLHTLLTQTYFEPIEAR
jgi:hypothetical protein